MPGPPDPRDLPGALDAPGRPHDPVVLAARRAESPAAGVAGETAVGPA